jgi:hypothetical protein
MGVENNSQRSAITDYFLTEANPSPFGPMCVPMTVVTLSIRRSRGTDWLAVCISLLRNSLARDSALVCRIANRSSGTSPSKNLDIRSLA